MCHCLVTIILTLIFTQSYRIVLVQYVESNPYETFEALFQNEIKILVYHGHPSSYIDVLYVGQKYGFVRNE